MQRPNRLARLAALIAILLAGCVPASTGGGSGGSGGEPAPMVDAAPADSGEPDAAPEPEPEPEPEPDAAPEPEPDAAPDPEPEPPTITVGTFNVRRFFDTVCDSGRCAFDDYERQYPPAEFDARAETVAYGVRTLDTDIVLLQEIESEECLDALTERLGDRYSVALIGELGYPASLDVVVLARGGGLVRVVRNADERIPRPGGGTTTFSRELLEVHLDYGGRSVIVTNGHYKAKNDDDPSRRLAEAQATRRILDAVAERNPDALIIFGGDLNDTPGSPPIDALEAGGDWLRVASELGQGAATYDWDGSAQAIDHIFHLQQAGGRYVPGSVEVVRDAPQSGLARSDHAALRARFELP